ncbi:MAG: hypothetical protein H7Y36_08935 [Armatimonadetes bacterium]|nr:hypothetical protein [Akkermansiaceae bacterium]
MRSTIHTNHPQPTQWSPGMSVCMADIAAIRYSLDGGIGSPKLGFMSNSLTKEVGR